MTSLCREAALGPIRTIEFTDIEDISADQVCACLVARVGGIEIENTVSELAM